MSTMQFFLNYPPPPLPPRELIINEGLKTLEQSKTDQQWLKNWIERKKQEKQHISLSNYRQRLIEHAHLLQQYEHALKHSNQEILLELKNQIQQSNSFIYDDNMIKNIQKQIQRRKSKRARLRRQKEIKVIDTKQISTNDKNLGEKVQEVKSIIQTIEQLKQLKNTRQQQQTDNTIDTTNDQLTEIYNLCTDKLNEYQTEINKSSHIELYNYLFNNNNQSFYESTDPDGQYLLRAHQNMKNLVQIRQTWDQYSSTHISSIDNIIPSQWHEPQVSSDSNWSKYIFNC